MGEGKILGDPIATRCLFFLNKNNNILFYKKSKKLKVDPDDQVKTFYPGLGSGQPPG
jgi:hypothetical protein